MSDIDDFVRSTIGRYETMVKPLIEDRNYLGAWGEMMDVVAILETRRGEINSEVHSGISLIAHARLLRDALNMGSQPDDDTVRWFEAYAAQTTLPLDPD